MRKMIIKGREVNTNFGSDYPFDSGNGRKTMDMHTPNWYNKEGQTYKIRETPAEMLERLAGYGYTKITFYNVSTAVRGYYDTIAYCK